MSKTLNNSTLLIEFEEEEEIDDSIDCNITSNNFYKKNNIFKIKPNNIKYPKK